MRTIKLQISYDGTNYCGWQIQPNGVSVQGVIEEALRKMTGEKISLIGASRTDAGVHALAQAAHFKTESSVPCKGFVAGLNSLIPDDMAIVSAEEMDERFHARKSAKGKIYLYRILVSPEMQALLHDRFWRVKDKLNIGAMKKAAKYFIGKKDFESFRGAGCVSQDSIRKIKRIKIQRKKVELTTCDSHIIDIEFEGDGFLRHMVRNIAGTLVDVGRGKIESPSVKEILDARDRKKAGVSAPACGLYLVKVIY